MHVLFIKCFYSRYFVKLIAARKLIKPLCSFCSVFSVNPNNSLSKYSCSNTQNTSGSPWGDLRNGVLSVALPLQTERLSHCMLHIISTGQYGSLREQFTKSDVCKFAKGHKVSHAFQLSEPAASPPLYKRKGFPFKHVPFLF